jgi:hypothetical protein
VVFMRRYLILILSMAIAIGCAKKKEEVTPTLTGGPIIVGVVKSEGKPLEGVTVSIEALGISSTTGADGSFKMTDLVEGAYKVVFEKEGYVKKEVEVTVGAEGTVNIGEVVLELSGSIEGVAKIEGEEVHKGIKVRVIELEGLEVETDSEGRYAITGIPSGSYTLELSAPGFDPKQISVDVVGGKTTTAEEVTFKGRKLPGADKELLYLKFDEGTGDTVKDYSGKKNNGKLVGGVTWDKGIIGGALKFDGASGYVEIPVSPVLETDITAVTIEAWVKWIDSGDTWLGIIANGNQGGPWETYGLFINRPQRGFYSTLGGGATHNTNLFPNTAEPDVWQFVCLTYDGTVRRLYVNGELKGEQAVSVTLTPTGVPFRIGHRQGSPHYFNG